MGGGASSPFKAVAPESVLPRQCNSSRVVHVVGIVVAPADGTVLGSPFGGHQGMAIQVAAGRQAGHGASTAANNHGSFRALAAIDFFISDAASSTRIRVAVNGSDVDAWAWQLLETHTAYNIMRSRAGNVLLSGGNLHQHSKIAERPDAVHFWERFNGGLDPVQMIQIIAADRQDDSTAATALGVGQSSEDLQRPRMAVERTLQAGDPVAILGLLEQGAEGELILSPRMPKGRGTITNSPKLAASLADRQRRDDADGASTQDLRVLPMALSKNAKNFRGRKW